MAKDTIYESGSPPHQTPQQENTFRNVLRKLCEEGPAGDDFLYKVREENELGKYNLSAEQKVALMAVGHATGKFTFKSGEDFFCDRSLDEIIRHLGPLAPLAGTWEGDNGYDTAPSEDGEMEITAYREQIKFDPFGPLENGEQILYGLKYSTNIWRLDDNEPFHEELGYWLWDFKAKQVARCFIVPRGVTLLAGGTVEPDAKEFKLIAEVGSETYGICSNLFLDKEFKTIRYELKLKNQDSQSFSYEQETQLKIKNRTNIVLHLDRNTLIRTN